MQESSHLDQQSLQKNCNSQGLHDNRTSKGLKSKSPSNRLSSPHHLDHTQEA